VDEEIEAEDLHEIREWGANKRMQKIQLQLKKQLLTERDRLDVLLKDKKEALSRMQKDRESIGVSLYNAQQCLAQLQQSLENVMEESAEVSLQREQSEKDKTKIEEGFRIVETNATEEEKKFNKAKNELDSLYATLRDVKLFAEGIESDVAVLRRQTKATEVDLKTAEAHKLRQDFQVNKLNETIKNLRKRVALYETQLKHQKSETKIANETLIEARKEMDVIVFEKRQLIQEWKGTLIRTRQRDQALSEIHQGIAEQKNKIIALEREAEGYKKEIRKKQLVNEQHYGAETKVNNQIQVLEEEVLAMQRKRDKLEERYALLKKSLFQLLRSSLFSCRSH
jgi:hypothetical protein